MTSKISSAKLLKESVKRSMAFIALLELLYFCYFAVGSLLYMQVTASFGRKDLGTDMLNFGAANPFLFAGVSIAAGILGMMQFAYLHNREKTDFYHSLPVRRERFFGIQYAAGVLIWLVVYSANAGLFLLICLIRGVCSLELAKAVLASMGVQLVCFLLVYSLMIFSMMLTGKLFAAIIGFGIICAYMPAVVCLLDWFMGTYFCTYSPQHGIMNSALFYLTPVYAVIKADSFVWDAYMPGEVIGIENIGGDYILAIFLSAILITAFCILLYRRRISEAAGKTMAFSPAARVIKFLLVLPLALTVQLFFYSVTYGNAVWGVFGLIFGLLVFSAAIEFVYTIDIREVFRDKGQLLLTAFVALAILAEFQFDLTGYDKWMPAQTEVKEAEVELNCHLAKGWRDVYKKVGNGNDSYYMWERNVENEPYKIQDVEALYEILEQSEAFSGKGKSYFSYEYEIPLEVRWKMENGTTKIRRYTFSEEKMAACFEEIWNSEAFQESMHPILKDEPEELLEIEVSCDRTLSNRTRTLSKEEREEFLDIFRKELRESTIEQALGSWEIQVEIFYRDKNGTIYAETAELYDGAFPETKSFLEKYGFLDTDTE